mmetsp:Transcript_98357/g.228076  ORF Transcript_98357/g.228076 Transcript_98357/m.228076 type:complete len:496 (-) Transcript_98357:68-1555(-)
MARLGLLLALGLVTAQQEDAVCSLGQACSAGAVDEYGYYWPRARGHVGSYSLTNLTAPKEDLGKHLAWKWNHPEGRYATVIVGGPLIDDKKNLYLSTETGMYKFSPDGVQQWFYRPAGADFIHTCPSIMDGKLFGNTGDGIMFAVSMETGKELWRRKHADSSGGDTAYVESYRGVVISAMSAGQGSGGNHRIIVVNATTGRRIWDYLEEKTLWNFMAMFVGDDTFVYMDIHGGVYRRNLFNGTRVWYTPPDLLVSQSFTDGWVQLGPGGEDGIAFACADHASGQAGSTGYLRALRVRDGFRIYDKHLEQPCTSWAVSDGKTVVIGAAPLPGIPGAAQLGDRWPFAAKVVLHQLSRLLGRRQRYIWGNPPLHSVMFAFDAATGSQKWRFDGVPPWEYAACRGDEEGLTDRVTRGIRAVCATAGWASPTMTGDGTVYTPHMDGNLYMIGDANSDGFIDPKSEVHSFDAGSASLHPGTAWASGLMATATCDTLFVFKF